MLISCASMSAIYGGRSRTIHCSRATSSLNPALAIGSEKSKRIYDKQHSSIFAAGIRKPENAVRRPDRHPSALSREPGPPDCGGTDHKNDPGTFLITRSGCH